MVRRLHSLWPTGTSVATPADLVAGNTAFCRGDWAPDAEAPRRKSESRQNGWVIAPITGNADLYKGYVTVGKISCEATGVRVLR